MVMTRILDTLESIFNALHEIVSLVTGITVCIYHVLQTNQMTTHPKTILKLCIVSGRDFLFHHPLLV
jgi:hypothetical protein